MAITWNGVNHFAISVPNLEVTIAWYEKVFGFKVFDRSEIPGVGIKFCHMLGGNLVLRLLW